MYKILVFRSLKLKRSYLELKIMVKNTEKAPSAEVIVCVWTPVNLTILSNHPKKNEVAYGLYSQTFADIK